MIILKINNNIYTFLKGTCKLGAGGYTCNPSYLGGEIRRISVPGQLRERWRKVCKTPRPHLNRKIWAWWRVSVIPATVEA
jgi:hypothetical protein